MDISPRVRPAYVAILDCRPDMDGRLMVLLRGMGLVPAVFGHPADLAQAFDRGQFDMLLLMPDAEAPSAAALMDKLGLYVASGIPMLLLLDESIVAACLPFLSMPHHDFVLMPYQEAEVKGRIQLLLEKCRRMEEAPAQGIFFGSYHFEPALRKVSIQGASTRLTHKEFSLALFLFQNQGRVWKREVLQRLAWGQSELDTSRTLDTHISRLRSRLQLCPANGYELISVYREGYRLDAVTSAELHGQDVVIKDGREIQTTERAAA